MESLARELLSVSCSFAIKITIALVMLSFDPIRWFDLS